MLLRNRLKTFSQKGYGNEDTGHGHYCYLVHVGMISLILTEGGS